MLDLDYLQTTAQTLDLAHDALQAMLDDPSAARELTRLTGALLSPSAASDFRAGPGYPSPHSSTTAGQERRQIGLLLADASLRVADAMEDPARADTGTLLAVLAMLQNYALPA